MSEPQFQHTIQVYIKRARGKSFAKGTQVLEKMDECIADICKIKQSKMR
jgi:hypothetical protein